MTDFRLNLSLRESQKNWKIAQTFKNYQTVLMICFNKESKRPILDPAIGIDLKKSLLLVIFEPGTSESEFEIKKSFDDFRDTLAKIKDAIQVQSAVPTRSPRPNEKWKVRSTRAPKLFPVAVETEFEKRSKNGVKFDRFYWRGVRQECVFKAYWLLQG